jgi:hypothetical protein
MLRSRRNCNNCAMDFQEQLTYNIRVRKNMDEKKCCTRRCPRPATTAISFYYFDSQNRRVDSEKLVCDQHARHYGDSGKRKI